MKKILLTAFIAFSFCGVAFAQQKTGKVKADQKSEKKATTNAPKDLTDEQVYKAQLKAAGKLIRPRPTNQKN